MKEDGSFRLHETYQVRETMPFIYQPLPEPITEIKGEPTTTVERKNTDTLYADAEKAKQDLMKISKEKWREAGSVTPRTTILPGTVLDTPTKSDGSSTDYYKLPADAYDLIDLIEHKNMNFAIGNIFKACYRLGQKHGNDDAYDLRKIIFFAERELKRLEQ